MPQNGVQYLSKCTFLLPTTLCVIIRNAAYQVYQNIFMTHFESMLCDRMTESSLLLWTLPTEHTLVRERRAPGQLKPLIMAAFLSDASLVTPWYYAGWLIMTHHRAGASFVTALAPGLSPHYSRPVTENKQALPLALTTALISSSVPVCNDSSEPA